MLVRYAICPTQDFSHDPLAHGENACSVLQAHIRDLSKLWFYFLIHVANLQPVFKEAVNILFHILDFGILLLTYFFCVSYNPNCFKFRVARYVTSSQPS